ncbi:helix-turn-helix domain-containing protein [Paenibacillus sp. D2_2]|uniref:helix-turn-helix domain-containing protein n=1 Tax=Paenibacillus sp. D2_2 TaxID=3073092 RepID=UPI002814A33D|nr:helix-turn-helix domain-containing protein [Paenibacillus sp. D2_2]WMT39268.1 helix-turn-helix domain-containing protein [Paenibacillus sp. D2_2]
MEERLSIRFASSEKEFLTQFGVNFGFTQVHSKVDRCYFLTSDAKALYHNLNQYAYNGSKECFPSQALLRAELGWSKHSVTKYVEELRQKGFIKTIRNPGRPLMYILEELHTISSLVHSEIVHEIRKELFSIDDREMFVIALIEYKESDVHSKVLNVPDPTTYKELIRQWFLQWQGETSKSGEGTRQQGIPQKKRTGRRKSPIIREEDAEKVGDPIQTVKAREKGEAGILLNLL